MTEFAKLLIQAGVVGTILTAMVALVRIAVGAERRRADDARETSKTHAATNLILSTNIDKLIGSVEHLATSQREMLALLHTVAASRDRSVT